MHQQLVLQIQSLTKKISKRQAEFNTLNRKIEELTQAINGLKQGQEELYRRVREEMIPLQRRIVADRITILTKLDQLYERADFSTKEQRKLQHFIATNAFNLIEKSGADELIPLYNRYSDTPLEVAIEQEEVINEQEEPSSSSAEEEEYEEGHEEWEYDKEAYQQQFSQQKKAKRKGKAVPQKQQNSYKSVRALYLSLVKALHPDKEPDEAERERKTKIMHQVTEAYRQNDLQLLLSLQMELEHIDQHQLDSLSDEQLSYYNTYLKDQVEELEQQRRQILRELAQLVEMPAEKITAIEQVYYQFNADIKQLKKSAKSIKGELALWGDELIVKSFLKSYQID